MSIKLTTASLTGVRVDLDLHSIEVTVNPLWNTLWKLVSRGYFSQKFGTSSKNTSLEEQNTIFSVKDLVHQHRCYHIGSKIMSISESKLAGIGRKAGKKNHIFKPEWWWPCRGHSIWGIKPLNWCILFVRFLNLSTVTALHFFKAGIL